MYLCIYIYIYSELCDQKVNTTMIAAVSLASYILQGMVSQSLSFLSDGC